MSHIQSFYDKELSKEISMKTPMNPRVESFSVLLLKKFLKKLSLQWVPVGIKLYDLTKCSKRFKSQHSPIRLKEFADLKARFSK